MAREQGIAYYSAETIAEAYEQALDPDSPTALIVVKGLIRTLTARSLYIHSSSDHAGIYGVLEHNNHDLIHAWDAASAHLAAILPEDDILFFMCDRTSADLSALVPSRMHNANGHNTVLSAYTALGGISTIVASRQSSEQASTSNIDPHAVAPAPVTVSLDISQGDHVIVPGNPRATAIASSSPHINANFIRASWLLVPGTRPRREAPSKPHLRLIT